MCIHKSHFCSFPTSVMLTGMLYFCIFAYRHAVFLYFCLQACCIFALYTSFTCAHVYKYTFLTCIQVAKIQHACACIQVLKLKTHTNSDLETQDTYEQRWRAEMCGKLLSLSLTHKGSEDGIMCAINKTLSLSLSHTHTQQGKLIIAFNFLSHMHARTHAQAARTSWRVL